MKDVDYKSGKAPPDYRCSACGAHGCKLWRPAHGTELRCVACAEQVAKERLDVYACSGVDQIGWWLPAVPDEEGVSFWGYTSVPREGVSWWKALPMALPQPRAPEPDLARRIIDMLRDAAKNNEHIPVEYAEKSPMRHECIGRLAAWQEALFRAETLESEVQPGADAPMSDADVAREFFRRFQPVKVTLGTWLADVAHAEEHRGTWFSAVISGPGAEERHAAGADGFTAALERARQLVRGGR